MTGLRKALPSRLYAIVDAGACAAAGRDVVDFAGRLLGEGVRLLQLRAKDTAPRDVLRWTDALARLMDETPGALLITNDRVDIALAAGVPHVHVGQDDLPPDDVRVLVGADGVVGLSTHSSAQIAAACDQPVDYLAIGPVFGTRTKDTGYDPVGLSLVREAAAQAARVGKALVAIGGITPAQAPAVIEAGADAVAVIGGLLDDGHPAVAVRRYLDALR